MIPLFKYYPVLAISLNYHQLGTFPTPINRLSGLERVLGRKELFIKRDDLSGNVYGGNKVRKLEFIFGDVIASGSKLLITSGAAGSNHALAVALYGAQVGFKVILMLFEQPYNSDISTNLMADYVSGAQMYLDDSFESHVFSMKNIVKELSSDSQNPFIIPAGGSSVAGVCGYINAAFELKDQIDKGLINEPSEIYVAMGTMGTAVGLMLGLKAALIKSRLVAVQVVPSYVADFDKFMILFESANRLLHDYDHSFPICKLERDDFTLKSDFLGPGYGFITQQAKDAVELLGNTDLIKLDGVYTGKAGASFIEDARSGSSKGTVLFWNTKSSISLPEAGVDYKRLPEGFHHYFMKN